MIKCTYYSKLLKLSFTILLISCFGLLGNYSDASVQGYVDTVGGITSQYDSGYLMSVSYKGVLNTTYLGNNKALLMYSEGNYFFWDNNSEPYISFKNGSSNGQGYPLDFLLCDSLNSSAPTNCSRQVYLPNSGTVSSVLSSLSSVYYGKFVQSNEVGEYYQGSLFCFSNSSYNKSICFYSCTHPNCGSSTTDKIGGATLQKNLNDSQNLSLKLSEIPSNKLGNPPGYIPGVSVGSDDITINNYINGDYIYTTCTYGEVINELEKEGYNKFLCYGGLDNFNLYNSETDYNPIPGTGKTIFQILTNSAGAWDTPQDWFYYWNGLYGGYDDMWESYPAVMKTWFDFYKIYGGDNLLFDGVREYCILKLSDIDLDSNFNGNANFFFSPECNKIIREKNGFTYDSSGNIILGVNWNGVGNMGGNTKTNPVESIQDFFNELKANITTDYSGTGFIPGYIVLFLCALILFRFISH